VTFLKPGANIEEFLNAGKVFVNKRINLKPI